MGAEGGSETLPQEAMSVDLPGVGPPVSPQGSLAPVALGSLAPVALVSSLVFPFRSFLLVSNEAGSKFSV